MKKNNTIKAIQQPEQFLRKHQLQQFVQLDSLADQASRKGFKKRQLPLRPFYVDFATRFSLVPKFRFRYLLKA